MQYATNNHSSEYNDVSVVHNDTVDVLGVKNVVPKTDGKENNKGSSVWQRYSVIAKYQHIIVYQFWIEHQKANNKSHSVSDYCGDIFASNRVYYWTNNLSKWQKIGTMVKKLLKHLAPNCIKE